VILGTSMDSYWPVSFHAQQTAEKALRGRLTRHQIEFEKTHNIGELLRLVGAVIPDLPHASARRRNSRDSPSPTDTRCPGPPSTATRRLSTWPWGAKS